MVSVDGPCLVEGWESLFTRVERLKLGISQLKSFVAASDISYCFKSGSAKLGCNNEFEICSDDYTSVTEEVTSLNGGTNIRHGNVDDLHFEMTSLLLQKLDSEEKWLELQEEQRALHGQLSSLMAARDAAESLAVDLNLQIMDRDRRIADLMSRLEAAEEEQTAGSSSESFAEQLEEQYDTLTIKFDELREKCSTLERQCDNFRSELSQKDQWTRELQQAHREELADALREREQIIVSEMDSKREKLRFTLETEMSEMRRNSAAQLLEKNRDIAQLRHTIAEMRLLLDERTRNAAHQQQPDATCVADLPTVAQPSQLLFCRILSASQTSLHNRQRLEDEPDDMLETSNIPRSGSVVSLSRISISSKTETKPFSYNDTTPTRLEEFERRNKKQLPHLRSSYPAESITHDWRELQEPAETDSQEDGSPVDSATTSLSDAQPCAVQKKSFLKKLQQSLNPSRSAKKQAKLAGKENYSARFSEYVPTAPRPPTAKPVAFVVDITPEKKKKKKAQ